METTDSTTGTAIYVGSDVRKAALDVAQRPAQPPWRYANAAGGIAELVGRLRPLRPQLIVLEATGGLERLVVAALALADLPVAVVTPRQVRDFARATGQLAKTDALDAAALAPFAEALRPTPRPLPDAQQQALAALVARRQQLVGMLTAEKHRLQQALPAVRAKVAAHIAWLEQALTEVDGELDRTLRASPLWRERDQLLRETAGGRADRLVDAAGPPARIGARLGQTRGHLGGPGAAQPREWQVARHPRHLGRPAAGPRGALHGGPGGGASQPHAAQLLRRAAGSGQAHEGRVDRLYA
jgi:Transposase